MHAHMNITFINLNLLLTTKKEYMADWDHVTGDVVIGIPSV
jgi:hypothetical protein